MGIDPTFQHLHRDDILKAAQYINSRYYSPPCLHQTRVDSHHPHRTSLMLNQERRQMASLTRVKTRTRAKTTNSKTSSPTPNIFSRTRQTRRRRRRWVEEGASARGPEQLEGPPGPGSKCSRRSTEGMRADVDM